jgi:signal transduction histidine kinase
MRQINPAPSSFDRTEVSSSFPSNTMDEQIRSIVHDLNNNVQVTLSILELVRGRLHRGLTDEMSKLIEQALMSAALAAKTGRRLMDVSHLAGSRRSKCAIRNLVASMEPVLRHALSPASELVLAFDSSSPTVTCDTSRLQNALLNLVLNARDAMPTGGTVVIGISSTDTVSAQAPDTARPYVRIVVTDTGHGMTREVLRHASTAFFTTKPAGKGNGLGLAAVKAFAEELDGFLEIRSTPGSGTSISICLPAGEDGSEERPAVPVHPARVAAALPGFRLQADSSI